MGPPKVYPGSPALNCLADNKGVQICLRNTGQYDQYGNPYKQWMILRDYEAEARAKAQKEQEMKAQIKAQQEAKKRQEEENLKIQKRQQQLEKMVINEYARLIGSTPKNANYENKIIELFGSENSDCVFLGSKIIDTIVLSEISDNLTQIEITNALTSFQSEFSQINKKVWEDKEFKEYAKRIKFKKNTNSYLKYFEYLGCKVPDKNFWSKTKKSETIEKALETKTDYLGLKNETFMDKINNFFSD